MANTKKLAKRLLDVIPPSMQSIRVELRAARKEELSVPQFRILAAIFHGINHVSDLAAHLGVSMAAMSKMIDVLANKNLITKSTNLKDRRQVPLEMTKKGRGYFLDAREKAQIRMSEKLSVLSPTEAECLFSALETLEKVFQPKGQV